jgi:hypothetical protein
MNKPPKAPPPSEYFSAARDYRILSAAEVSFFKAFAEARAQFPANRSIDEGLRRIAPYLQDPLGKQLDITIEFDVQDPRKGADQTIFLGTLLTPPSATSKGEVTHYMCLAAGDTLLAKYHADFDFDWNVPEKKPSPHLQIGGRIPRSLSSRYAKCHWHTDVNKPRIPALPICTPLLWHWVFLEYESNPFTSKFLSNRWWKKLIKDAEAAAFTAFFSDGAALIRNHPEKGLLNSLYVPLAK